VTIAAFAVAAVIGIGIAVSRPGSPWCDDFDNACPVEVRYDDRMYVVDCTETIPPVLRDEQLRVRYHAGDDETERRAWTVDGVDPAEVILLDETDAAMCEGTEFAYGESLSGPGAAALLRRLAADD